MVCRVMLVTAMPPLPHTPTRIHTQNEFRGSDEERRDVLDTYRRFRGNMPRLFEHVLCSEEDVDAHRFMDMIEEGIKDGERKGVAASWTCNIVMQGSETVRLRPMMHPHPVDGGHQLLSPCSGTPLTQSACPHTSLPQAPSCSPRPSSPGRRR